MSGLRNRLRLAVGLAAVLAVPVALAGPTAAAPRPAAVSMVSAAGSSCTPSNGDACGLSASAGKAIMTFTANLSYPVCTNGQVTGCTASVGISTQVQGFGPLGDTTVDCPWGKHTFTTTSTSYPSPALAAATTSVTCTLTWVWNAGEATPTYFAANIAESDGTQTVTGPNYDHSAESHDAVPPLDPSFRFAPVSGEARTFTFTDTSKAAPGLTVNPEDFTYPEADNQQGVVGFSSPVTYTFPADGLYAVTESVTDDDAQQSFVTQDVDVVTPGTSPPTITVIESLKPHTDAGRFSLAVDGKVVKKSAADGGSGEATALAGRHIVSQTITKGALTGYSVVLTCTVNGKALRPIDATSAIVTSKAATAIVCTFTDTRTTVRHCDVPQLHNASLTAAKRRLRAAHCAVGPIHRPAKKKRHATLVVAATSPAVFSVRAAATKVHLTLRYRH
jgi:hypothetical protein